MLVGQTCAHFRHRQPERWPARLSTAGLRRQQREDPVSNIPQRSPPAVLREPWPRSLRWRRRRKRRKKSAGRRGGALGRHSVHRALWPSPGINPFTCRENREPVETNATVERGAPKIFRGSRFQRLHSPAKKWLRRILRRVVCTTLRTMPCCDGY